MSFGQVSVRFRPPLSTTTAGEARPGYTPAMRQSQLALAAAGAPGVVASVSSLRRWATHGTGRRRKRGGASSTSLRGEEELLLVLCRLAWPKATADQISAYIARNSASGWIYSRMAITRCEQRLGLTRKRGSTTALQALTPFHQARRHKIWNLPHPAGIAGTPRARLIDIDEAGIGLEQGVGLKYGKSFTVNRVRQPGVYGRGVKYTWLVRGRGPGERCKRVVRSKPSLGGVSPASQILAEDGAVLKGCRNLTET